MDRDQLRQSIKDHFTALKTERVQQDVLWPIVAKLLFSIQKDLTSSKTKSMGINYDLYDGSGQQAVRIFAAGIVANICPRGNTWFSLRYRDPKKSKLAGVAPFQKSMEDVFYSLLAASNWYEFVFEFFFEAAWACTAAGFKQRDDANQKVNYQLFPTGTYWISDDSMGTADTLFRVFNLKGAEIVKMWPDLDQATVEKLTKDRNQKFEILHAVRPRESFDPEDRGNRNFPFESTYWLTGDFTFLEEGGFEDFPFLVHRIEREPGSAYGTGPGFRFIRDAQIQQAVAEDLLLADQLRLKPSLLVPDVLQDREFDRDPDGITWVPQSMIGQPIKALNESIDRMVGTDREQRLREAVERAYSIPFFLMENDTNMTKAEFLGKQAQHAAILVPIYGRATSEVLDPMWPELIRDAIEFKILPEVPPALAGEVFDARDIEYISPFQTLQKQAHIMGGLDGFLQTYGLLRNTMPEAAQKLAYGIDPLKLLDMAGEANGVTTALTDKTERDKAEEALHQAAILQAQQNAMANAMAAGQGKAVPA